MAQQSPWRDYGYRAYGELSHFVFFLLQKVKTSGSLLVVKRWESYMLPNHSSFASIEEEDFLVGTPTKAALEKTTSYYLQNEFRSSARGFLEDFTGTVLSIFAARSNLGQGSVVFVLRHLSGAITIPFSLSSEKFWMAQKCVGGRTDRTLRLAKLNFNPL